MAKTIPKDLTNTTKTTQSIPCPDKIASVLSCKTQRDGVLKKRRSN
jgi:hypothetical protein